jgi:hypothetical protein
MKKIIWIVMLLVLAACSSNPQPGDGKGIWDNGKWDQAIWQ